MPEKQRKVVFYTIQNVEKVSVIVIYQNQKINLDIYGYK